MKFAILAETKENKSQSEIKSLVFINKQENRKKTSQSERILYQEKDSVASWVIATLPHI